LGQATLGKNQDMRLERRGDMIVLVEVIRIDTDPPRKPVYNDIYKVTVEGLEALAALFGGVMDGIEGKGELPVELSTYDRRFQQGENVNGQ
jgi:hypothetical protein